MKRYLFILLLLLFCGYVASQNKSDTQKQNKASADTSQNLITKDTEDTTTIGDVKPVFDISIAKLIDSVSNPKAYLYDQKFAPGSGHLNYVQYLLIHKKSTIDTIEVGRNEGYLHFFTAGKIIQYFPYKKNAIGIAILLIYRTFHDSNYSVFKTYWSIFDLESKKSIFYCNPMSSTWTSNNYAELVTLPYIEQNGYSIAINNMEIIIKEQLVGEDMKPDPYYIGEYRDETGNHVTYTNEKLDLKYGKYIWQDSSFVLIK